MPTTKIHVTHPSVQPSDDVDKYARALSSLVYDSRKDIYHLQLHTCSEVIGAVKYLKFYLTSYEERGKLILEEEASDEIKNSPDYFSFEVNCTDGFVKLYVRSFYSTRFFQECFPNGIGANHFAREANMPTTVFELLRLNTNADKMVAYIRDFAKGLSFRQAKRKFSYYGIDLSRLEKHLPQITERLGQLYAQYTYTEDTREITVEIEPFVYANGAQYYFHKNSCWWNEYYIGSLGFEKAGGKAIRVFENGKLKGRAWYWHRKSSICDGVLFNMYGIDKYEFEKILATLFNTTTRLEHSDTAISVSRENMFVNSGMTVIVGKGYRKHIPTNDEDGYDYRYCDCCDDKHITQYYPEHSEYRCAVCAATYVENS